MGRDLDSYLAGIFDGEGWISAQFKADYLRSRRAYSRLTIGVGMTVRRIPEMLCERFGGTVKEYKNRRGNRRIYQWYVSGSTAIPALELFSDLLIVKREEAVLALELARYMGTHKCRAFRRRGERVISETEIARRIELAERITLLKRSA